MSFVKVKFLKHGVPSGRSYTYKSEIDLRPGDIVDLPSGKVGVVVDEPVDAGWLESYGAENLKCIVGRTETAESAKKDGQIDSLGKITSIEVVTNVKLGNAGPMNGKNGSRKGLAGMLGAILGYNTYDGYKIKTNEHEFHILIENQQCCCEDWGYFYLNDNEQEFVGAELMQINLTDTALNKEKYDNKFEYGLDCGGIQFVDFETDRGVLQFAVYNGHNGYYGHSIIIAKDMEIMLQDTL